MPHPFHVYAACKAIVEIAGTLPALKQRGLLGASAPNRGLAMPMWPRPSRRRPGSLYFTTLVAREPPLQGRLSYVSARRQFLPTACGSQPLSGWLMMPLPSGPSQPLDFRPQTPHYSFSFCRWALAARLRTAEAHAIAGVVGSTGNATILAHVRIHVYTRSAGGTRAPRLAAWPRSLSV